MGGGLLYVGLSDEEEREREKRLCNKMKFEEMIWRETERWETRLKLKGRIH